MPGDVPKGVKFSTSLAFMNPALVIFLDLNQFEFIDLLCHLLYDIVLGRENVNNYLLLRLLW